VSDDLEREYEWFIDGVEKYISDHPDEFLVHHGVKGMKWGVRNDSKTSGFSLRSGELEVDPTLHQSTKIAAKEVASMIQERYGFRVNKIIGFGPDNPEFAAGTLGYVKYDPSLKNEGDIYTSKLDMRKTLKGAEEIGWYGKGSGNLYGLFTHESAHAIFHSPEKLKPGFLGPKLVGGNAEARDKALKASVKVAKKSGISLYEFSNNVSGYAGMDGMKQETEAELFSQYHWNPNPPAFVKTWGETLHREMGIDGTPFREKR
jgi:hypothetical protein